MRRANAALRVANADLEQFAYSASHDLREPLRTVRIYCQLLKQTYAGKFDSEADAMLGYCVDGAGRMNALIDDLLAYIQASSDSGTTLEAVSLESALAEVLLNLAAAIAETGAAISHDPMPAVRVAPVHAQQLFQNMIGNALKYRSAAPPVIHVGARKEGTAWIFSVQDNGIGIAPEHHGRVFELGKRLHTSFRVSRHGYWPSHLQEVGGALRRPSLGGVRTGKGFDLLLLNYRTTQCRRSRRAPHPHNDDRSSLGAGPWSPSS